MGAMNSLIPDIERFTEDYDIEAKKASGRDGQGELPQSFFETYSAMANTYGGFIFLGVQEKPKGKFTIKGISNPPKVLKSLWDGLNNRQQVSINLLNDKMVDVIEHNNTSVIRIQVPRAPRRYRPVYVGTNPSNGTYRRNYEGDYRCDEETVRRMMAEQVEDARDAELLEYFDFNDIDENTLKAYRKVIQKLLADLKVPFKLQDTKRIDQTPVHEALREALVNSLIHADYTGRVSVLVVKRPDLFGFRNPGIEGKVTNDRLKCITLAHPHDITKTLSGLVKQGFLESDGATRGTYYFFPGEPPHAEANLVELNSEHSHLSSEHNQLSSEHSHLSSEHNQLSSE
ncbi:MAG: ATP-binding protein, partial [Symploca sp. SIO3E6]|nr:ATP-binding protein [Caldora sp. SIO3E6]